jgi:ribosomal protein S18 acetylase RimI-like enzyme
MGVSYFKRYRMEIRLDGRLHAAGPVTPQYQLLPWHRELIAAHADAKFRSFYGEIDSHVFPCLGDPHGCRRLMEDISLKPGFLPGATWLALHIPRNGAPAEYCGTVQGIADGRDCGGIQNLGVTPEHRGCHVGTSLLLKALDGFWRAGLTRASLEVTAQNALAVALYRKLGFRRVKTVYKAVEVAYS